MQYLLSALALCHLEQESHSSGLGAGHLAGSGQMGKVTQGAFGTVTLVQAGDRVAEAR